MEPGSYDIKSNDWIWERMTTDLNNLCVSPASTVRQAIACIDKNGRGIVLITDEDRHLVGTVTDGDIRRAMLDLVDLESPVSLLLERRSNSPYPRAVTAPDDASSAYLLTLMQEKVLRQIPLIDKEGRVKGLATVDELLPMQFLPIEAVVMAGGFGSRLRPLTDDLPKPMLLVGGRPLMERIIDQLRSAGINRINITTHYKPDKITSYFGDGSAFGVEMNYVNEDLPLGTAGALGLIVPSKETLLVINGDILTHVDFKSMLIYHKEHKADMTVAVRRYEFQVPYGVIECEEETVCRLTEKPQLSFFINAGIYLIEPDVFEYIPKGQRMDMTDLIQRLLKEGRRVVSFPIREYWLDIGHHASYRQAQEDVENGRFGD